MYTTVATTEAVEIKTEAMVHATEKEQWTPDSTTEEDPVIMYPDEGSGEGYEFESDDEEENEYLSSDYDSEELKRSRRHKYKRAVSENERKYTYISNLNV